MGIDVIPGIGIVQSALSQTHTQPVILSDLSTLIARKMCPTTASSEMVECRAMQHSLTSKTLDEPEGHVYCRNTYSALSALAGHYNNFGPDTNVPKKRLDRLTKVCGGSVL